MRWICPCGTTCLQIRCEKCGRWHYGKDHKIEILKNHMMMRIEAKDWRAVSELANDLRILEAKS